MTMMFRPKASPSRFHPPSNPYHLRGMALATHVTRCHVRFTNDWYLRNPEKDCCTEKRNAVSYIYIYLICSKMFEAFPSIRSQEKRELAQISWPAALAAWVASLGPWHAFWIWASYPAASTHDTSLCADVPWPQKRCIGWWWVVSRTTKSVDFAPPCAWKQEVPLRLVLTHCDVGQLRRCFPFFGAHRWSAKVIAPAKVARLVTKRLHIIQSARIAGHCNQKQGISSSVRFHTVLP